MFFLAPKVLVASRGQIILTPHKADVGTSRLGFNAATPWTVLNRRQSPRRRYPDPLGNGKTDGMGCHSCQFPCIQLPQSKLRRQIGTNASDVESRKLKKYQGRFDNEYIFQPTALEVQASLGESSEIFKRRPCRSNDDQRNGSFLSTVSIALHIGNATCVVFY